MSTEVPQVPATANIPINDLPSSGDPNSNSNQQKRRPPRHNRPPNVEGGAPTQSRPPRRPRQPKDAKPSNEASTSSSVVDSGNERKSNSQPRTRRKKPAQTSNTPDAAGNGAATAPPPRNRRGANFGAGLTTSDSKSNQPVRDKEPGNSRGRHLPQGDDLTSSLIRNLSTPPYPDCPICFSSIRPDHAIWSCSPSIPIVTSSENQVQQYCWTSFHVRCIRSWADKSVKDVAEAWRARGEPDRGGDWRCPGCQAKREAVPSGYWYETGVSATRPLNHSVFVFRPLTRAGIRVLARARVVVGIRAPCNAILVHVHRVKLPPDSNATVQRKISSLSAVGLTSGVKVYAIYPATMTLNCGKHACEQICHEGDCGKCDRTEVATCWCGKEQKTVNCGEGKEVECFVEGDTPWIGKFGCDHICERLFDCGKHKCQEPCHPPSSKPAVCPRSPSKITHCPCGKNSIAPSSITDPSQYTFPARTDCSTPIPTCDSVCSKPHPACQHPCTSICHSGLCPPCTVQIVRPCRCGGSTKSMPCHEVLSASAAGVEEKEVLCDRPCQALRACGRHQCRRVCCPLASLAVNVGRKGKRRAVEDTQGIGEEQGGWHECDLVCGKMLSCGNHKCEERDHKGVCPPCLRSSFEIDHSMAACLTSLCAHADVRSTSRLFLAGPRSSAIIRVPDPHPLVATPLHPTHAMTTRSRVHPAPPLPTRAARVARRSCRMCVARSRRRKFPVVRLMACGFHHCERLCHGDECGPCTAPCGKSRKSCLPNHHPCTRPCHAPATCPETDPCQSIITLTCACGRIRQAVHCGRTASSSPNGNGSQAGAGGGPKCTSECQIAKRNARLADALGISADGRDRAGAGTASYADDLVTFARANMKFLPVVEKAFADFVTSEKRTQVLPHMPPERRKFVHDLASVYRMDTQMVDQEPHRSVELLRRVDTRLPSPLLSQFLSSLVPPPSLGKLADFRSLKSAQPSSTSTPAAASWRSSATTPKPATPPNYAQSSGSGSSANTHRGWTAVVSKPGAALVAAPHPTASLAGITSGSLLARQSVSHGESGTNTGVVGSAGQRTVSPAVAVPSAVSKDPVPDDWEDDV
ncbi:hypothetical protein CVT25_011740 [Psilocybe cyanescens]|uniref:R3H domain-containing protein n=1 Tax=Psilocybe cyanescens TaxID=93625 RepID=A0A409WII1_PSICY|nr:hypothetical protein CVT25_011740 [Psilocybe cyanescens]